MNEKEQEVADKILECTLSRLSSKNGSDISDLMCGYHSIFKAASERLSVENYKVLIEKNKEEDQSS